MIIRTSFRNPWVQSKPFSCLRFAIFCKLKVIAESLEGLWQWQGSRSYHLEICKSGSLGSGLFLTTGCSRFFLEMVQRDDFYLPKSKRGRGGRRQPIWRAASVEEFDSGSLPRLVISSSRRRRLRSEKTGVQGAGSDEEKVGRRCFLRHESVTNGIPNESVSQLIGQKGRTNRRTRSTASSSRL